LAGFALVLALFDRRFELEELGWQVPILSLLALGRGFTFNLHSTATWHGWSVRLLSLSLVAIFLHTLSGVVRIPEEWRERDFHRAYSCSASTVVGFLLWYELVPLNIAIGWAVLISTWLMPYLGDNPNRDFQ
jgi:disulfide bond formation protein DsbB